jgi:hypothetical protein
VTSERPSRPVWQEIEAELIGADDPAVMVAEHFLQVTGFDAGDLRREYLVQVWRDPTTKLSRDLAFAAGEGLCLPLDRSRPLTPLDAVTWVFIACLLGRCDREDGWPQWELHASQLCEAATALRRVLDSEQLARVLREAFRSNRREPLDRDP